jgi:hypothetical protein
MSEQKVLCRVEQHIVIKLLLEENVPATAVRHRLQQPYGEECVSWTYVFEGVSASERAEGTEK